MFQATPHFKSDTFQLKRSRKNPVATNPKNSNTSMLNIDDRTGALQPTFYILFESSFATYTFIL